MRRSLTLAVAMIATLGGARVHAATLYSSSKTFNSVYTNPFNVISNRSKPLNGLNTEIGGNQYLNAGKLNAGVSSASVTVDVDGDTGTLTAMEFAPFSVPPTSVGESIATEVKVVVADFPNPPTIQTVSGAWQESITINGVSGAVPTFTPAATPAAMNPVPLFLPWYEFFQEGILAANGSIFLTGTYQVVGPLSTVSVPINVEVRPSPNLSSANTFVQGSNSFGDGFNFLPNQVAINYRIINPVIFDGDVDQLHFNVQINSGIEIIYFAQNALPEPNCCLLLGIGGGALTGLRRRRR